MTICEHDTSIVEYEFEEFSVLKCTWGCGEYLIDLKLPNHMVKTLSISEIKTLKTERCAPNEKHCTCVSALREQIAELESKIAAAQDDRLQNGAYE